MIGTPKQVKYARDILKRYIENAKFFLNKIEPLLEKVENGEELNDDETNTLNKLSLKVLYKMGWKDEDSEEKAIKILKKYIQNLKEYINDMENEKNDFSDASFIIKHGKDYFKYVENDMLYVFPVVQLQEFYGI